MRLTPGEVLFVTGRIDSEDASQFEELGPLTDADMDAQADNASRFMTSVFTAQDVTNGVGLLSVLGAQGGWDNLRDLATSPSAPCVPLTDRAPPIAAPSVTPAPSDIAS